VRSVATVSCVFLPNSGTASSRRLGVCLSGGRVRQVTADVADVQAARDLAVAVGEVQVDAGDEAGAEPLPSAMCGPRSRLWPSWVTT
jgi:hypothetical protein